MESRNALARLADVAEGTLPLLERLRAAARAAADELKTRLLGRDFEQRVATLKARYLDLGGDPFGFDPSTASNAAITLAFFHRMYFRTEVFGIENVPAGRVLLVANHSGQVPIDAAIVGSALFFDANPPRVMRAMVEKWTATLPFVSAFFNRVGQVVGVPENARRLLEMGEVLLAFPEGIRGVSKPFDRRYQLEQFGLGFMRLAIETDTPIVPVAVIGAEEQYVSLGNLKWAARLLDIPVFPLIPQLFVPGAQMPLPTKYRIHFGEPMRFKGDPEDDDTLVADKVWLVRQTISDMLRRGLASRRSVFL
ncbi:MAG TPA: lysophospholipid acyltransferase family protein [Polyangiaceae bacterium]|nr:lysophospholipid acyltransferase family protein [Polyangiaceae bacterium]